MGRKKMRWIAIGVAVLGLLLVIFSLNFQAFDTIGERIYIATSGNDNNSGTIDQPFLTFDKAKLRARQIKASNSSIPITILARGGTYYMATPLNFTAADSGSAGAPITYASYPGETAIITGAKEVSFQAVTDQGLLNQLPETAKANVKMADLTSLGLANYDPVRRGAFLPNKSSGPILSVNNQPMTLARYPNTGHWADIVSTLDIVNGFQYSDPGLANCSSDPKAFIHGFPYFGWADSDLKIQSHDSNTKTIIIEGGFDSYGVRAKTKPDEQFGRFFCYNATSALDSPGEYVFTGGKLLFWPITDVTSSLSTVTVAEDLVTGTGVKYVRFERLNFEGTRSNAMSFTGSSFLKFSSNLFTNSGNDALILTNVTDSVVGNNTFKNLQERAVNIKGGNLTTLASSNDVIINNDIQYTAQWINASRAAIRIEGVGIKVYRNEVAYNPQGAVTFVGNDHDISKNYFHNILEEGADAAAVYGGRRPTDQGNKITYNYFKNNGNKVTTDFPGTDIYLDDALRNVRVEGNIVDRSARSFLLGGGSYNVFKNNIFTALGRFDCRGCMSPTRSEFAANKFHNPIIAIDIEGNDRIITLANLHGIVENVFSTAPSKVKVIGVEGLNGTWSYKIVSPSQLRLLDATGGGNYTNGGYAYSPYGNGDIYEQMSAIKNNPAYTKYEHLFDWEVLDNLGDAVGNVFEGNVFYLNTGSAKPWVTMDPSAPEFFNPDKNIIYGSNTPTISGSNISADPQFIDPSNGDFRFSTTSPALAMGIPQPLLTSETGKVSSDELLAPLVDQTIKVGQAVEVTAVSPYFATEQAQNPVFTASNLPPDATFNPTTRKLNWTPTSVGVFGITITAQDDYLSTDKTFKITVTEANRSSGGDNGEGNGSNANNSSGSPDGTSSTSNDFILPPVQIKNPTPDAPGPIAVVKDVVRNKVKTVVNKEAIVASVATINSAVQDVLVNPISGRGTAKTTGRLIGILLVIVLPLVAAITIVILRRRARL